MDDCCLKNMYSGYRTINKKDSSKDWGQVMLVNHQITQNTQPAQASAVEPLNLAISFPTQAVEQALQTATEIADSLAQRNTQAAEMDPSELSFNTEEADRAKKGDYDDDWELYRDAENDSRDISTLDQLKSRLGIEGDDWSNYPEVGQLVESLQEMGQLNATVINDLYNIKTSHSRRTLEYVADQMNTYLANTDASDEEKQGVVTNGLHDIAFPSDIDQGNVGSCAAASCHMKMAIERPRSYARMLTLLARGRSYRTTSGHRVRPNNSWRGDSVDNRNYSARIVQNALMEFAGQSNYDSSRDDDMRGTFRGEQEVMMERIFGYSIDRDWEGDRFWSDDKDDLFQYVEDDIARGRAVNVSFDGHSVLVVGIDRSGSTTEVIINSWGEQYSMTEAEFKRHLEEVRTHDDDGRDNRQVSGRRIIGDR